MREFLMKQKLSFYLALTSIVLTTFMSHPTIANLIVVGVNVIIVFTLRKVSQIEGKMEK